MPALNNIPRLCSHLFVCLFSFYSILAVARPAVSYLDDVKPILEQKCIACHACYDSPCQLNMTEANAIERGANEVLVYDGGRTESVPPTRIGIDAVKVEEWRDKGFFSVLADDPEQSLFWKMIKHGRDRELLPNQKLPDSFEIGVSRVNECTDVDSFSDYASGFPDQGMPHGVSGLSIEEFDILKSWVNSGSPIESEPWVASSNEQKRINQWESYLNKKDLKSQLVSRYIFEHLFLAQLYFPEEPSGNYYRLVRSYSPPGTEYIPVPSLRPNQLPKGEVKRPFYYRFMAVTGTKVHKTHITYPLHDGRMDRYDALFYEDSWEIEALPDYQNTTNPFVVYEAIPTKARYQFLLDDTRFFIMNFIRGPVCRGQIATDVINDRFYAFFVNPDVDISVQDYEYFKKVSPLLDMPGAETDLVSFIPSWDRFASLRSEYNNLRRKRIDQVTDKIDVSKVIWKGDVDNHKGAVPALTIFRHHDNASVEEGLYGDTPKTAWLIDYPVLEQTFYSLAVNYDVFGNVGHQAATRLYFDLIRVGAETNFLYLLPSDKRSKVRSTWYQGMGAKMKLWLNYEELAGEPESGYPFVSDQPYNEMLSYLKSEFSDDYPIDSLNDCKSDPCVVLDQGLARKKLEPVEQYLRKISAQDAEVLPYVLHLPETTVLKVNLTSGDSLFYTLVRDRAHTNVAFMLREEARYIPERDRVTLFRGLTGSYPNFIFELDEALVEEFSDQLINLKDEGEFERLVTRFGVRRMSPRFWPALHSMKQFMDKTRPNESALYDVNRYVNL